MAEKDLDLEFIVDTVKNEITLNGFLGGAPIYIGGPYKVHLDNDYVENMLLSKNVIIEFYDHSNKDYLSSRNRASLLTQMSQILLDSNDVIRMNTYIGPNTVSGKGDSVYVKFNVPSIYDVTINSKGK